MLFEVEKQAMERWPVKVRLVCEGFPCPGRMSAETPQRVMRQNSPELTIAGAAGKSDEPFPESR